MVQRVSARHIVLVISLASILTSLGILVLGSLLITRSRLVSGNIGLRIYQIYGDSILGSQISQLTFQKHLESSLTSVNKIRDICKMFSDGIQKLLPNIPGKESVMRELGIVIHDIFINDIGDTLDYTIFIVGVILVTLAALQFLANLILLIGASLNFKKLIPSVLLTRLFYFSTFWGSIDAYRKLLNLDEMAVFLV